ncbi:MAG: LysR family transcriptional regulator [Burkholderiaceae bacterium]|nr:LysR family transcriptional regulator [Burkholderiaceae bacterium]
MKLPPLNALRAFDATARHLSVRHAADELFVTPGAVSQQLKLLEQWLGQRLLERSSRGIGLTVTGAAFHAATHRHLRAISAAAERLRPQHNEVGISVLPSFATRCLVPHLPAFTRQHPSVQVRVDANSAVVDFERESFDLTVREAVSIPAPLQCQLLFPVVLYPVCSPEYRRTDTWPAGKRCTIRHHDKAPCPAGRAGLTDGIRRRACLATPPGRWPDHPPAAGGWSSRSGAAWTPGGAAGWSGRAGRCASRRGCWPSGCARPLAPLRRARAGLSAGRPTPESRRRSGP